MSARSSPSLTDVGFTIPAGSPPYWVGEAMGSADYIDLERTPKKLAKTIRTIANNAVHLAKLLPATGSGTLGHFPQPDPAEPPACQPAATRGSTRRAFRRAHPYISRPPIAVAAPT